MLFALTLAAALANPPVDAYSCPPFDVEESFPDSVESYCAPAGTDSLGNPTMTEAECMQVFLNCDGMEWEISVTQPDGSVSRTCHCGPGFPQDTGTCQTRPEAETNATPNPRACDTGELEVMTCEPMPDPNNSNTTCWECWLECQKTEEAPEVPETEPEY